MVEIGSIILKFFLSEFDDDYLYAHILLIALEIKINFYSSSNDK